MSRYSGGFTLPGEAGYEELTFSLAKEWGADAVRDSDGTALSAEIVEAGYEIYSTICIIRGHNQWIKDNLFSRQQVFLMSRPVTVLEDWGCVDLLAGYFSEQFNLNELPEALALWQVFDRTTNQELPSSHWHYEAGCVYMTNLIPGHSYTVNFLAYRIWEEISMYNHTTNNWNQEHIMQLDPVYPEVQEYLLLWLRDWCESHPHTQVVRFTSLFYNFAWIWGADVRNRHLFTDWASYDFTVSPRALALFSQQYGYHLSAEDFIHKGYFHATHRAPSERQKDWMAFVQRLVLDFGRKLVAVVHQYQKKAFVFYDDSWIGLEPYSPNFAEFGFDGLIKCVFSGFEVRLCAGVSGAAAKELRLHPYLFPTGLGGAPSFMIGGDPAEEARSYWRQIRRALLQVPIDRIGLGGYLHLTEGFPDFVAQIRSITEEFRQIQALHREGKPLLLPVHVAVLTAWGSLRSFTCSGHFHENPNLDLINLLESLSGFPVQISFFGAEDLEQGIPEGVDVIINAGTEGSSWSGGRIWHNEKLISALTLWAAGGGVFLGVGEPSALAGYSNFFRMAAVLGVDRERGERICHGRWFFTVEEAALALPQIEKPLEGVFLTSPKTKVWLAHEDNPLLTVNAFHEGYGIYLASYSHSADNCSFLRQLLLHFGNRVKEKVNYLADNRYLECNFFPESQILVVNNITGLKQEGNITTGKGIIHCNLEGWECRYLPLLS